jgi:transaldolase
VFDELAEVGVDYDDVTDTLEREGVEKFEDSFRELLDSMAAKLGALALA